MKFIPQNEMGTIVVFAGLCSSYGIEIISIGQSYPDAVIVDISNNQEYKVEFEFLASNFLSHGHDIRKCDFIICWKNDIPTSILPIIELESDIPIELNPLSDTEKENIYLKLRVSYLERELSRIKVENPHLNKITKNTFDSKTPKGEGWRIEVARNKYWGWRRGSKKNREYIYGGKLDTLPENALTEFSRRREIMDNE